MEKRFSKAWVGSKQPRKQRKYSANAPLHIKQKMMKSQLSKPLRKKYGMRNSSVRKGDTVKIMVGKFKNKEGKVNKINLKKMKVKVDGIQIKKKDGSKVDFPLRASNLQIIELNLDDKKRIKKINTEAKNVPEKTTSSD